MFEISLSLDLSTIVDKKEIPEKPELLAKVHQDVLLDIESELKLLANEIKRSISTPPMAENSPMGENIPRNNT